MGCSSSAGSSDVAGRASELPPGQAKFHAEFLLEEELGKGTFAHVCGIRRRGQLPEELAVKILDFGAQTAERRQRAKQDALWEARLWQLLGCHPHVVTLHEVYVDRLPGSSRDQALFVMERCGQHLGTQRQRLAADDEGFSRVVECMLSALEYLHSHRIVHRDVKPENFLVVPSQPWAVKLCDFGHATVLKTQPLTDYVGTAPFWAPEMVLHEPYGLKVDVWACGVIVYLILYGCHPYQPANSVRGQEPSASQFLTAIADGRPPSFGNRGMRSPLSLTLVQLLETLLCRQVDARLGAAEALEHPLFDKALLRLTSPASESTQDTPMEPALIGRL